ncbi:hypothetical protein FD754_022582 [Muntiacus muntjak]|uniref:Neurexin/syndecan/glycophorin C domain-containing protein n=1 Tax=Muntiacus muntjak TaxID=9888 RepID=A0A5N3V901_MUNMU|nr:hypothetical protein FD754_022582 [Muntiacus muntjak]
MQMKNSTRCSFFYTFQMMLVVKNPLANAGNVRDAGSSPGSGRSPGGGRGSPIQYSFLENPMDRGVCLWTWSMVSSPSLILQCHRFFIFLRLLRPKYLLRGKGRSHIETLHSSNSLRCQGRGAMEVSTISLIKHYQASKIILSNPKGIFKQTARAFTPLSSLLFPHSNTACFHHLKYNTQGWKNRGKRRHLGVSCKTGLPLGTCHALLSLPFHMICIGYTVANLSDSVSLAENARGELVIPLLVEDPLATPPIATRAPSITPPPTFRPLLTIIETTKDSLSMTSEAGLPCLSDQGSDGCDDDGLVISGYGSGETFDSNLPPTDDEDFYTTFSLVTDKSLSTSIFEGGYKALAPKWESKDFRPNKASESSRTTATSLSPELIRFTASSSPGMAPKLPAGKMNNRELKPQPDLALLPLPTAYELDSTKLRSPLITSPMFRNVPTANPTEPGVRRVPGASEVIRESSSTTGMVVGIVAAAALCILILLYAMYKYRNRDEGSYQVDETRNYISNSAQSNGALLKEKPPSSKGGHRKQKNKDKEYYV